MERLVWYKKGKIFNVLVPQNPIRRGEENKEIIRIKK